MYRRFTSAAAIVVFCTCFTIGCSSSHRLKKNGPSIRPSAKSHTTTTTAAKSKKDTFQGLASYYGPGFHGKTTANGERFNMYRLTAAHKTLPFNTKVKVINMENRKSVVVRINDRGPFKKGRVIDLSLAAAKKIGLIKDGVVKVIVEILD